MNAPRVSVVVPTYRRTDLLERCLEALLAQQGVRRGDYEIVVCDDGPADATRQVVEAYAQRPDAPALHYVPVSETQGPAGARNAGWQRAAAAVIAFTDDDTVPDPAWLREGLAAIEAGADAVSGSIEMPIPAVPSDYELDASHLQEAEFATANCIVRRGALAAVGGFDPRYTMAWREDSDLHFSLLEHGFTIVRAPQARVLHPLRPGRFAVGLGMQKKVMFDTLLYKKFPQLYRQRIRGGPPWFYLAVTFLLLAALALAAGGLFAAAAACTLAWLGCSLWFFARRLRGTRHDLAHVGELLLTSLAIPPLSIFWRVAGTLRFGKGFP
jgi:glycosyltransferase involved in cell wall biosynthesis